MKRAILLIVFTFGISEYIYSQELYSISPNTEKAYKKEKLYFPKHKVKIKNYNDVYYKNKLIFKCPFEKIYHHRFELFEDETGNQFVIITPVLNEENDYSSVNSVLRELIYIIPLSNASQILYSNLERSRIGTKRGYNTRHDWDDNYGTLMDSIDLTKMKIKIMIDNTGEEPYFKEFDIHELEKW